MFSENITPDWSQWDDSEFDVDAMQMDFRHGNFNEEDAEDYRHEHIVLASLINGQFSQARKQCDEYGLDYAHEYAAFKVLQFQEGQVQS